LNPTQTIVGLANVMVLRHRKSTRVVQYDKNLQEDTLILHAVEDIPDWLKDNPYILRGYRAHLDWRQCLRSMFKIHNETLNVWTHVLGALFFLFLMFHTLQSLSPAALGSNNMSSQFSYIEDVIESTKTYSEQMEDAAELQFVACADRVYRWVDQWRREGVNYHSLVQEIELFKGELAIFARGKMVGLLNSFKATLGLTADVELSTAPIMMMTLTTTFCFAFSSIFHLFYCQSHESCIKLQRLDYGGICIFLSGTGSAAMFYGTHG
jgi:hypothetical protein